MKSYEEISNRIMQRGDEIIASRRNRSELALYYYSFAADAYIARYK